MRPITLASGTALFAAVAWGNPQPLSAQEVPSAALGAEQDRPPASTPPVPPEEQATPATDQAPPAQEPAADDSAAPAPTPDVEALPDAGEPKPDPAAREQPSEDEEAPLEDPAALLARLDADVGAGAAIDTGPQLSLYGFADFTFSKFTVHEDSVLRGVFYSQSAFAIGGINLYLAGDLGHNLESLAEVRFTYLPNGTRQLTAEGVERTDTTVNDYSNFFRPRRTGGLFLERVWLQYTADPLLVVRAGSWLTPYGVWNVDHGSPTIIPVQRPYTIGSELIPERQTGVQLRGTAYPTEALSFSYVVAASNGRNPVSDYADLDENKAATVRLSGTYRGAGTLELGGTCYYGRYTDVEETLAPNGAGVRIVQDIVDQYDELALGLDLLYTYGGFHGQAEFISNQRKYTEAGRKQLSQTTFAADKIEMGTYGVLGYRLEWFNLMPYVIGEYFSLVNTLEPGVPQTPLVAVYSGAGLNARPVPTLTLKLEASVGDFYGDIPDGTAYAYPAWALQSQAAWAF